MGLEKGLKTLVAVAQILGASPEKTSPEKCEIHPPVAQEKSMKDLGNSPALSGGGRSEETDELIFREPEEKTPAPTFSPPDDSHDCFPVS